MFERGVTDRLKKTAMLRKAEEKASLELLLDSSDEERSNRDFEPDE